MYLPQHPQLIAGLQLQRQGFWPDALKCYQQVESESLTESLFMQGFLAYETSEFEQAFEHLQRVIQLDPDFQAAFVLLANIALVQDKLEDAHNYYQQALALNPEDTPIWKSIAKVYAHSENWLSAINALGTYLKAYPTDTNSWHEMADYYHQINWTFHQSICYERILALEPSNIIMMERHASTLWHLGRSDQTHDFFNKVLQLNKQGELWYNNQPQAVQQQVTNYKNLWHYFKLMIDYAIPIIEDPELLSTGMSYNRPKLKMSQHKKLKYLSDRKLRIGYLSRELKYHSSTRLIWPLLANHSNQVEIFAYNDAFNHQEIEMKQFTDHWREVHLLDTQRLAEQIRQDQIDILVDLGGLSNAGRYGVYALHPAPIQITGLGFVFSSLCPDLDYCFSDAVLCNPELEKRFPEQVIYLKSAFHLQIPPEYDINTLPYLKNSYITLGSANTLNKLNSQVLQVWVQALKRIPDSRLILKTPVFNDPLTRQLYRELFQSMGIAAERIDLMGQNEEVHLTSFYSQIDIALDPFPYQGGVTTCDALWMGVPVVCMLQEKWRSRALAASILSHVGLEHWLVRSENAYIDRIVQWTQDIEFLKTQRLTLRDQLRNSVICDGPGFAREVEDIYQQLAQRHLV